MSDNAADNIHLAGYPTVISVVGQLTAALTDDTAKLSVTNHASVAFAARNDRLSADVSAYSAASPGCGDITVIYAIRNDYRG